MDRSGSSPLSHFQWSQALTRLIFVKHISQVLSSHQPNDFVSGLKDCNCNPARRRWVTRLIYRALGSLAGLPPAGCWAELPSHPVMINGWRARARAAWEAVPRENEVLFLSDTHTVHLSKPGLLVTHAPMRETQWELAVFQEHSHTSFIDSSRALLDKWQVKNKVQ
jgi:hypothetical protein